MQKIFLRYISLIIAGALAAMLIFGWLMQSRSARNNMVRNSNEKLDQVVQILNNSDAELKNLSDGLSEDYLTRARAFAYIVEKEPDILDSRKKLNEIKEMLSVDELHAVDSDGILTAGTVPKYIGMDFRSTKQSKEFLSILNGKRDYLIQKVQPNGAEKKMFQYIGVKRRDEPGILQVGIAPDRLLRAKKLNELSYVISRVPADEGYVLFAVNVKNGKMVAHSEGKRMQEVMSEFNYSDRRMRQFRDGKFYGSGDRKKFYVLRRHGNLLLGTGVTAKALYAESGEQMGISFLYLLLTSVIMLIMINYLLKQKIIDGVHRIAYDLKRITEGHLETVVEEDSNPEFRQLSQGINQMVGSVLEASVKVTKVIDTVDLPIGVFEYHEDSDHVMATERLRRVLRWSEEEAEQLFCNRKAFEARLQEIMNDPLAGAEEIYYVSKDPDQWIRIHMTREKGSTFGVVVDVTEDIREKRRIEHERDYDHLTGLCNISIFHRTTERLLESDIKTAAMIMMDLDCFKGVNDHYGHDWGDQYLKTFAGLLDTLNGPHGIAGRRSGDEFCLFLHGYNSKDDIRKAIEDFYNRIEEKKILFPDGDLRSIKISSGLVWVSQGDSYIRIMKDADMAMYETKRSGKGFLSECGK